MARTKPLTGANRHRGKKVAIVTKRAPVSVECKHPLIWLGRILYVAATSETIPLRIVDARDEDVGLDAAWTAGTIEWRRARILAVTTPGTGEDHEVLEVASMAQYLRANYPAIEKGDDPKLSPGDFDEVWKYLRAVATNADDFALGVKHFCAFVREVLDYGEGQASFIEGTDEEILARASEPAEGGDVPADLVWRAGDASTVWGTPEDDSESDSDDDEDAALAALTDLTDLPDSSGDSSSDEEADAAQALPDPSDDSDSDGEGDATLALPDPSDDSDSDDEGDAALALPDPSDDSDSDDEVGVDDEAAAGPVSGKAEAAAGPVSGKAEAAIVGPLPSSGASTSANAESPTVDCDSEETTNGMDKSSKSTRDHRDRVFHACAQLGSMTSREILCGDPRNPEDFFRLAMTRPEGDAPPLTNEQNDELVARVERARDKAKSNGADKPALRREMERAAKEYYRCLYDMLPLTSNGVVDPDYPDNHKSHYEDLAKTAHEAATMLDKEKAVSRTNELVKMKVEQVPANADVLQALKMMAALFHVSNTYVRNGTLRGRGGGYVAAGEVCVHRLQRRASDGTLCLSCIVVLYPSDVMEECVPHTQSRMHADLREAMENGVQLQWNGSTFNTLVSMGLVTVNVSLVGVFDSRVPGDPIFMNVVDVDRDAPMSCVRTTAVPAKCFPIQGVEDATRMEALAGGKRDRGGGIPPVERKRKRHRGGQRSQSGRKKKGGK